MSQSIQKNMSLSQLLAGLIDVSLAREITITGISEFSGDVESGDLFIALGASDYSSVAISFGAVAVICEPAPCGPSSARPWQGNPLAQDRHWHRRRNCADAWRPS